MISRHFLLSIFSLFFLALFDYAQTPSASRMPQTESAPRLVVQLGNIGGVGLVALSTNGRLALTAENDPVSSKDFSICL